MTIDTPVFLYVEDDANSRFVLKVLLERLLGYKTLTMLETSENFVDRVKALNPKPNIIFLDIQMGPLDGYEMIQILRSLPDFQKTAIIAMTANVMSHDVEALKHAGFSGLIGKPIVKDVFPQLVERILAGEAVWYVP